MAQCLACSRTALELSDYCEEHQLTPRKTIYLRLPDAGDFSPDEPAPMREWEIEPDEPETEENS